jgi:hypothetical protein
VIGLREEDGATVARVRNNIRIQGRIAWSLLATLAVMSAMFVAVLEFHMPLDNASLVVLGVLLLWLAIAFYSGRSFAPGADDQDERILRKTIDDQHKSWRWRYALIFFIVTAFAGLVTFALSLSGLHHTMVSGDPASAGTSINFAWFAILAALQICFGPDFGVRSRAYRRALNDELTRMMQRRTAMFGYVLCVVVLCTLLGVTAFRPQWGLVAMPGAIAAVIVLPGLYFLVLQWRAGRDG